MSPKLPSYFVVSGVLTTTASVVAKKTPFLIDSLGRSNVFEWGCGILSSLCISIGLFLALYGLITQRTRRLQFWSIHVGAFLAFSYVVGSQFAIYVLFTKVYQLDQPPSVLPKLVENARTGDSESKRRIVAQNAYKIYGVTIAYRQDNGTLSYYDPTTEDIVFQQKFAQTTATNHKLKEEIIGGQLKQLPFVIAINMIAIFLTFVVGSFWIALKKPESVLHAQPGS